LGRAEIVMWFLPLYLYGQYLTSGYLLVFLDPRRWLSLPELPVGHPPTSIFEWMKLFLETFVTFSWIGFAARNNPHDTWD
jgi:hypothetical protein